MILIIDDDIGIRTSLTMMLRRAGYEPHPVASPKEAIAIVRKQKPRLILMDMNYSLTTSGDEGLILLRQVKIFQPDVPVILMTAWGSIQLAVKGMRAGAFDFVTKPWNNAALMQQIENALEITKEPPPAKEGRGQRPQTLRSGEEQRGELQDGAPTIIGRSPALLQVLDTMHRIAPTNASVLITGESGTGKELIAEAIHRLSPRRGCPFVKVNLGGMSQSLFESEMFGYRQGAFTGANTDREGRFAVADSGTIFLDEIGDLDMGSQVKLLRVLQDHTFEPLGDTRPRQVDVRVVCATNADLPKLIREHRFREDLYYRINLITLRLPALRERREDIPLLVRYFMREAERTQAIPCTAQLLPEAERYLASLPWPGNIRQLKNVVERTLLVSQNRQLGRGDFERQIRQEPKAEGQTGEGIQTLEDQERQAIIGALKQYDGNVSRVALALGLSRGSLYRRMERYGIK
ncbi:MAG: sigma-54-dependent Fis family transcriptional regulator [Bacteroidaceae bacterium]|nr:sigma-54-dependent Fis family transcriptional regulator [Bacteroidaceae bacterium]